MRGNWSVTPGVAATQNQDLIHRVVGKPGVVLISEGPPSRVQHLLTREAKKTARFVPDVPIHTIQCGSGEGQVPVAKLQKTLTKLPNALTPDLVERRSRIAERALREWWGLDSPRLAFAGPCQRRLCGRVDDRRRDVRPTVPASRRT